VLLEQLQCSYRDGMTVAITIRNVPDEVRDELAAPGRPVRPLPPGIPAAPADGARHPADAGPAGQWVVDAVDGESLFAPEVMPFEVGNILRRQVQAGILDASGATLAHADLVALTVQLYPYAEGQLVTSRPPKRAHAAVPKMAV
jgi:hypothetical protein